MTIITLNDAIRELRELGEDYDAPSALANWGRAGAPSGAQRERWHRKRDAIHLAIAVLTEKAEVSPARRTDPATSHRAAPEEIKAGSAREKILLAAERLGGRPVSARYLAACADLKHQRSPWKRVSELAKAGFLLAEGTITDPDSGHEATTYIITTKGYAACAGLRARTGAS